MGRGPCDTLHTGGRGRVTRERHPGKWLCYDSVCNPKIFLHCHHHHDQMQQQQQHADAAFTDPHCQMRWILDVLASLEEPFVTGQNS